MKLQQRYSQSKTELPESLARLYFERAASRIRLEAMEILSALYNADALRSQILALESWLPLPAGRIDLRKRVTQALVAASGLLPDFRN